jgi:hypothetical protein
METFLPLLKELGYYDDPPARALAQPHSQPGSVPDLAPEN